MHMSMYTSLQAIKDWHLLSGLGIILGIEAVLFAILQAIAFTVTIEFGEEVNKENPVTINVIKYSYVSFIKSCHRFAVAGNGCYRGSLYHHLW